MEFLKSRTRAIGMNGRVVLIMSVVTLLFLLSIAYYSHSVTKRILIEEVEENLFIQNEMIANEVSALLEKSGEAVFQLAGLPIVDRFMDEEIDMDEMRTNPEYLSIQRILTATKNRNDDFFLVSLVNERDEYFISNDDYISDERYDVRNRPWYEEAIGTDGISYSSPYLDYQTNEWTILISYPIYVDDERVGNFSVTVHLNLIASLMEKFEDEHKKIILVSKKGNVLYDTEKMWSKIPANQQSLFQFQDVGENYYVSMRGLEELGWYAIVYTPESAVLAPLNQYERTIKVLWSISIIGLLLALAFILNYYLKDIPAIVQQINKIKDGDFTIRMKINRQDEIGEIAHAIEQMTYELRGHMGLLDFQANYDALTKLPNRRLIEQKFKSWSQQLGKDERIAVGFFDLDHFKYINDSKGHAYGDELLIKVGERIRETMPVNSFLGRFGGDEFIFLIRVHEKGLHVLEEYSTFIHRKFENPFNLFEQPVYISTSIGLAVYPENANSWEEVLVYADTALYQAKKQGRNRTHFFENTLKEKLEKENELKISLKNALLEEQFFLHYQPQLDMVTEEVVGAEALIRWKHPTLGMVSPAEFIPVAEDTGQIIAIGEWVIDEGIRLIRHMQDELMPPIPISVNVCALQLREHGLVEKLAQKLKESGIDPALLTIEITESVLVDRLEETVEKLHQLKKLGVRIALDDFGTGYSSLNYLRYMPIDSIKVDRSFIQQIEESPIVQSIMETIVSLGVHLDFYVVAEGVETASQLAILRQLKIDTIQGYYYSKPLTKENWLRYALKENEKK